MRTDVAVVGGGGHAKVAIATLRACGHDVVAVVDDDPSRIGTSILGVTIAGPIEPWFASRSTAGFLAIGENRVRRALASRLSGVEWRSAIHPRATVHDSVTIGPGTLICAGAVIQPDAEIGAHAIVNTSASVDHDCAIGEFSHVAPGARLAGEVRIGAGSLIGVGAQLLPGVNVGSWSIVGAGAVVLDDVADAATTVGVPARVLQGPVR